MSHAEIIWLCIGFGGQLVFTARFLVQWIASERRGESVVPIAFWYLSIAGSWLLLTYAVYRKDPVIIAGQLLGVVVYGRNLVLIHRRRNAAKSKTEILEATPSLRGAPAQRVA
ncbi:MAG: lipid-A-disaccharide synthase N-terminal domain-containing protein [Planctomycetota bacterium]